MIRGVRSGRNFFGTDLDAYNTGQATCSQGSRSRVEMLPITRHQLILVPANPVWSPTPSSPTHPFSGPTRSQQDLVRGKPDSGPRH